MIGREELTRLARARGLSPWQEEKRYLMATVLHALRGEEITMKGGTYLWFFHGLDRFSEDLDFTAVGIVGADVPSRCAESLGVFGIAAGTKVIKDDRLTLSFRVDARGPLYGGELSACRALVEISRREEILLKPVAVRLDEAGYLLPIDLLRGMALEEVAAEKTRALLRRKKVRDAYDLWFLLKRKGVPLERDLVNKKLAFYHQEFAPQDFAKALETAGEGWSRGLKPLVFGEVPGFEEVKARLLAIVGE